MAEFDTSFPVLVLAAGRARDLGHHTLFPPETMLAFRLRPEDLILERLRGLADPTAPQFVKTLGETAAVPMDGNVAVDLAKQTRLLPALLIWQTTPDEAKRLAEAGYPSIEADDVAAQFNQPPAVERITETSLPIAASSSARIVAYRGLADGSENLALIIGNPRARSAPPVRIHSACFTGDVLGSLRCDCGPQLHRAVERIAEEGGGVILYLDQEGRGIGITNKLRSYLLQERGLDTLEANNSLGWEDDARNFGLAAAILKELGLTRIKLLSDNPIKVDSMAKFGILVQSRVAHTIPPNGTNDRYLETKTTCCGHFREQTGTRRTG
ncbi:GTP cyclohydrolase II [Methyloligella solikamskensis]|uniref:GTP cyclohydrolase-2 n=1 Tax=Methyloligella solikamskensis TaxID=1177756 RepID=A0ABW3J829_9HYPH